MKLKNVLFNNLKNINHKWLGKNFSTHLRKNPYWFFRDVNFDYENGSRYKSFDLKRDKENKRVELIPYKEDYKSVLVWLYAGDLIDYCVYQLLEYNNFPTKAMKIVILSAPFNPITYHTAVLENNWFNILDLPDSEGNRYINKREINKYMKEMIFQEINHQYTLIGDYKNIFIGGFSQSACMALHSGLSYKENLGGIISFSGFKFDFSPIDLEKKKIPILACNGQNDDIVIVRQVKESFQPLINLDFNLKLVLENGLHHAFSKTSLQYASEFLKESLKEEKIDF